MPDHTLNDDMLSEDPEPYPLNDGTGRYRAMHGKRTVRITQLLFVPKGGQYDRFLPIADLRLMDVRKDNGEVALEFSGTLVVITGQKLRMIGNAIAGGWCAAVEAFDPEKYEKPDNPAVPFVESIRFFVPKQKLSAGDKASKGKVGTAKQPDDL